MAVLGTNYTARQQLPDLIERGRDNTLQAPIYTAGALVAPTSGTITVYDNSSVAVVDAAAVTISASVAQYTIVNATTAALSLSDSWRVEWSLVMPDGVTHSHRTEAALVRSAPHMPITDADLFRISSALDPSGAAAITSETDFQNYLDESWVQIQSRLIERGRRPWLIISPAALRESALYLTLALIYEDLATRLSDTYEQRAERYRAQYEAAWQRLRVAYDADDDGTADDGRRSVAPTVWLSGR